VTKQVLQNEAYYREQYKSRINKWHLQTTWSWV